MSSSTLLGHRTTTTTTKMLWLRTMTNNTFSSCSYVCTRDEQQQHQQLFLKLAFSPSLFNHSRTRFHKAIINLSTNLIRNKMNANPTVSKSKRK
jgi:hypothetical protein